MSTEHNVDSEGQNAELHSRSPCEKQLDCDHEIVDEDGLCRLCAASVPWSWMYDEYTHVVPGELECDCGTPTSFEIGSSVERGVEIVRCDRCWTELSYKKVL